MREQLTLNDGTVINGHCIPVDGSLFVYLYGKSLTEGFALFSDKEKISRITEDSYGHEYVYEGYTEIFSVSAEYGNCNLVMRKADANA